MNPNKYVIGLTGTIGSGKSTVSGYLQTLGAFVVDADKLSRKVMEKGTQGLARCVEAFGSEILLKDGTLDRKKLAGIVFSSEEKRRTLNAIVHPLVLAAMQEETDKAAGPVLWDVPLLFESGMDRFCSETWLVVSSEETCVQRVMQRDGATREEARKRIDSQMPLKEKTARAAYLLCNEGSIEELQIRVLKLWQEANLRAEN